VQLDYLSLEILLELLATEGISCSAACDAFEAELWLTPQLWLCDTLAST
jgi:hypothetical protein